MKKIIFTYVFIFLNLFLTGQDTILQQSEFAEAEFHTAINPLDSNNIVVVTMHGFEDVESSYFSIYYTKDFGETWETSSYNGIPEGYIGTGDPVIAFNSEGVLVLAHLLATEDQELYTVLSESLDYGATWDLKFIFDEEFTDKPWLTIDKSIDSPYEGNIYVITVADYVQFLAINPEYTLMHNTMLMNGHQLPSIVSNKAGDIFASSMVWDYPLEMYVTKYTDGGETLDHSTFITTFPDYTFSAPDISTRFQPTPYLAIDNSNGLYSGRLYFSYTGSELINEEYFNIFLTYSDDDGKTWSEPKIVHSNTENSVQQFYSSIYVNNAGVLIMDWYDRSNYENVNQLTDFFIGISYDGGESFSEMQLNSESMDFAIASLAGFEFGIGEYHQLVATNNTAISFWSDGRMNNGDLNIYYAKVDINNPVSGIMEQSLIQDKISISSIYPQPVKDNINLSIELNKKEKIKLNIIAMDGSIIDAGHWQTFSDGTHDINIPIDIISGQYILQVKTEDGYFKNQKFLVVK